jgi:hypothetical protein
MNFRAEDKNVVVSVRHATMKTSIDVQKEKEAAAKKSAPTSSATPEIGTGQ